VDPVPEPMLLRNCGSPGNRTRTSGSVARNSGHWTTEAVFVVRMQDKNGDTKTANISLENLSQFKYLRTTLKYQI
jgi:hypothetical protein